MVLDGPPEVRVASAVATADDGTGGLSWAGVRRTTVRGGSTFHDDGSCGGLDPLAGTGGCPALRPASEVREPPGLHGVCPACPEIDRRTAAPGGRPTVPTLALLAGGAPGVPAPARLIAGASALLSA
ncbi:hypothetical protein [Cellulomonas sp. Root485]|uniref:hypothetical protein n=1 Tax=Cellulomonas sp. Root485 TaxID=1736546 RepID=UPI00138F3ADF|nr:hypothetical protein [Cellulomonas sp. Root485]